MPLSRLHVPDITAEVVGRGIVAEISGTTIWRWLSQDAIRPWRQRSWIFPRDPDFESKAGRVLDLYAGCWEGKTLGKRDYVISADEKTSIQARIRCHPTLAAASDPRHARRARIRPWRRPRLPRRMACHRARIFGRCEPTTGIEPFARLVNQVMTTEPYPTACGVFWVVDNGSSHRGQRAIDRIQQLWPNARLVQLPIHASWLNQIEIYFSVCPTQGPHPQRLHRPHRRRDPPARLRAPLQIVRRPF